MFHAKRRAGAKALGRECANTRKEQQGGPVSVEESERDLMGARRVGPLGPLPRLSLLP